MRRALNISCLLAAGLLLLPTCATAQSGTIAGSVQDETGGVLPGVTVEASSPALIEKVRSVVTDAQGVYKIVDLRPGVYAVTFTLPGFSAVKREGIELVTGVTSSVNAELRPGNLSETITVTGQSPLIDVQNSSQHRTVTTTMLEQLPAGRQMVNMALLIPGTVVNAKDPQNMQDVGTNSGDTPMSVAIHGSNPSDMPLLYDGMRVNSVATTGGGTAASGYGSNAGSIQEIAIDTSGASAEYEVSGMRANLIPKQGGNTISVYFLANFANSSLESSNLDAAQQAQGLLDPYVMNKTWDLNPAVGGPLKRDKLWFFASYRYNGTVDSPPGAYRDVDPADWVYTPNYSHHETTTYWRRSAAIRLTLQTSPNSKLAVYADDVPRCNCQSGLSATTAFEASTYGWVPALKGQHLYQASWNWTASNRLLFEFGQTWRYDRSNSDVQPSVPVDRVQATEQTTGVVFRGLSGTRLLKADTYNNKAIMTFVTGSHSIKAGFQSLWGELGLYNRSATDYSVTLSNGSPVSATFVATPYNSIVRVRRIVGLFAQEQWTRKRLTTNLGLRFDYVNSYIPVQNQPAGRFAPARSFPELGDLPNWKDLNPRFGVTYDLFGNGRTAVRWNLSRYMEGVASLIATPVNPSSAGTNTSTTRSWTDANKDFIPQESELGPNNNANFGTSTLVATTYAPGTATGWGHRGYNWETMTSVQHELRPGLAVEAAYFRRWAGNFRATDNTLVTPANFDPFYLIAPVDPRLPGGGGYRIDGLYNITPTLFGQNLNTIRLASNFGKQTQIYDGLDFTLQARMARGMMVQGGVNEGRTKTNTCFAVDSPQALRFCDVKPPFQPNVKFLAIYPLPIWGLQASAVYQSLPGPEIGATWAAPAASVQGLGRPLAGGARTVSIPLIAPASMYGERLHQVDLRFTKRVRAGRARVEPQIDLYNLLNSNAVLILNNTFGPSWQNPTGIESGRLVKFGVQISY